MIEITSDIANILVLIIALQGAYSLWMYANMAGVDKLEKRNIELETRINRLELEYQGHITAYHTSNRGWKNERT